MLPSPDAPPAWLESAYADHHASVYRAAYRISGSSADAEDALQTVFMRLLNRARRSPEAAMADSPVPADELAPYLNRAAVECQPRPVARAATPRLGAPRPGDTRPCRPLARRRPGAPRGLAPGARGPATGARAVVATGRRDIRPSLFRRLRQSGDRRADRLLRHRCRRRPPPNPTSPSPRTLRVDGSLNMNTQKTAATPADALDRAIEAVHQETHRPAGRPGGRGTGVESARRRSSRGDWRRGRRESDRADRDLPRRIRLWVAQVHLRSQAERSKAAPDSSR